MTRDELRRAPRARVCCRVDVRQRFAAWSAVTEEMSTRGCRIVTTQRPRLGAKLDMRLSSDLFPEELEVVAEVVWSTSVRMGVAFADPKISRRTGSLSATAWVERVLEQGRATGSATDHVVPVIQVAAQRSPARLHGVVAFDLTDRRRSG